MRFCIAILRLIWWLRFPRRPPSRTLWLLPTLTSRSLQSTSTGLNYTCHVHILYLVSLLTSTHTLSILSSLKTVTVMGPNYANYHCKLLDIQKQSIWKEKKQARDLPISCEMRSIFCYCCLELTIYSPIGISCYTENMEVRDEISHRREKQRNITRQSRLFQFTDGSLYLSIDTSERKLRKNSKNKYNG